MKEVMNLNECQMVNNKKINNEFFLALDDSNKNYQGLSTVIVVLKC